MHRRFIAGIFLAAIATVSHAQFQIFDSRPDPDWREAGAPPPPALTTDGLIPIELAGSALRFGVDPASIRVGKDGIVHYVVVASSTSGAVNGIYEGVRCSTGEVKVFARHTPGAGWVDVKNSEWRSMHDQGASRHTLYIARNGVCIGHGAGGTPQQIARALKAGPDYKFTNEVR